MTDWEWGGYDVGRAEGRREAARQIRELIAKFESADWDVYVEDAFEALAEKLEKEE